MQPLSHVLTAPKEISTEIAPELTIGLAERASVFGAGQALQRAQLSVKLIGSCGERHGPWSWTAAADLVCRAPATRVHLQGTAADTALGIIGPICFAESQPRPGVTSLTPR